MSRCPFIPTAFRRRAVAVPTSSSESEPAPSLPSRPHSTVPECLLTRLLYLQYKLGYRMKFSIFVILILCHMNTIAHAEDPKPADTSAAAETKPATNEFKQEIRIKAPISKVWAAITEPAQINLYYLAPIDKLELKAGGQIVYGTKDQPMIFGKVVEVEAEKLFSHTFKFEGMGKSEEKETLVTYKLTPTDDGGTLLTLTHTGFEPGSQTLIDVTGGWPYILEGLKKHCESQ